MTPTTVIVDGRGMPTAQMQDEWRSKVSGLPTKRPLPYAVRLVIADRCPSREFQGLCRKVLDRSPEPMTQIVNADGTPTQEFQNWWAS